MQKSSETLCQVQDFTCWVRSYWVKRTHILFHSPHNFFVRNKSASHCLVKEPLSLCFICLDLIQKNKYTRYKDLKEHTWCISFHMGSYQATYWDLDAKHNSLIEFVGTSRGNFCLFWKKSPSFFLTLACSYRRTNKRKQWKVNILSSFLFYPKRRQARS